MEATRHGSFRENLMEEFEAALFGSSNLVPKVSQPAYRAGMHSLKDQAMKAGLKASGDAYAEGLRLIREETFNFAREGAVTFPRNPSVSRAV